MSVLISIRPEWCEKIANGKKTIEVRKSAPKEVPFKAYIYCTNQKINGEILLTNDKKVEGRNRGFRDNGDIPLAGKVIGEFICDKIYPIKAERYDGGSTECSRKTVFTLLPAKKHNALLNATRLTNEEIFDYLGGEGKWGYAWHISDLKIYDKPKELSEFYTIQESGSDCCCGCVWHETPLLEMPCRTCPGDRKYLYRPPQSWQYVDEVKE